MPFTMFFFPAMLVLLVFAAVLLVQGLRRRDRKRQFTALVIFALVGMCLWLLMEFITRM